MPAIRFTDKEGYTLSMALNLYAHLLDLPEADRPSWLRSASTDNAADEATTARALDKRVFTSLDRAWRKSTGL